MTITRNGLNIDFKKPESTKTGKNSFESGGYKIKRSVILNMDGTTNLEITERIIKVSRKVESNWNLKFHLMEE